MKERRGERDREKRRVERVKGQVEKRGVILRREKGE